jgi:hypothetical protein
MRGTDPFAPTRETEPGPFETEIIEEGGEPEDESGDD